MSQPKRDNADGTYTPIPTMNKAEWDDLRGLPVTFPILAFPRQITVNSQPRPIVRTKQTRSPK